MYSSRQKNNVISEHSALSDVPKYVIPMFLKHAHEYPIFISRLYVWQWRVIGRVSRIDLHLKTLCSCGS